MEIIPAASVLITDIAGRVLLVQRGHEPQKGRWSLPGGKCEPGETPAEAAVREAKEETGLEVRVLYEAVRAEMPSGEDRLYDVHGFAAEIVGGELRADDDADQVRWVHARDLHRYELTTGLQESLRRAGFPAPPDEG